jgi:hypothetical protein
MVAKMYDHAACCIDHLVSTGDRVPSAFVQYQAALHAQSLKRCIEELSLVGRDVLVSRSMQDEHRCTLILADCSTPLHSRVCMAAIQLVDSWLRSPCKRAQNTGEAQVADKKVGCAHGDWVRRNALERGEFCEHISAERYFRPGMQYRRPTDIESATCSARSRVQGNKVPFGSAWKRTVVTHRLNVSQSQIPAPMTVAANRFACVVAHAAAYPP